MTDGHTRRSFLALAAATVASASGSVGCGGDRARPRRQPDILRARVAISDPSRQEWPDVRRTAERTRLVALHAPFTQAERAAELKAADRSCLTFAYQDWGFAGYEGQRATGLYRPECEERGWLAHDATGAVMENRGFPGSWLVDCGVPGYAERWVDAVVERLEAGGGRETWDGVLLDDVNAYVALTDPHWPAAYSSHDDHYARAVRPAIAKASARLRARGYRLWANLGGWGDFPIMDGLVGYLDVCMEEFFGAAAGRKPHEPSRIANGARSAALCASLGKVYLGVAQLADPADAATATYADALLRIVGERGHAALATHATYADEPWLAGVGAATGTARGRRVVEGGLYSRRFERGTVFANTGAEPVTLPDGSSLAPLEGRLVR